MFGIDAGYGYTKLTTHKQQIIFRSIIGNPRKRSLIPENAKRINEMRLEINGKEYSIGSLAEKESFGSTLNLERNKINVSVNLILAALALVIDSSKIIKLVTGLPISQFQEQKNEFKNQLERSHEIVFKSGPRKKSIYKYYCFKSTYIPPVCRRNIFRSNK